MKKYAIVDTWNGEGYSYQNKILHIINDDAQPLEHCKKLALEQITHDLDVGESKEDSIEVTDSAVIYNPMEDDFGAIHFVELHNDSFAIEMRCNVNEIFVLTEDEYKHSLSEAVKNADQDDIDDLDLSSDRVFIGAYSHAYDRQFEIINYDKID